jgi:hypothetical protein
VTPIKERVFSFVENNLGMEIKHNVSFSLQDRNYLNDKATQIHGDLNGLFYRKGDNFNVYVLYGLREKDLIAVIAHELAHAWQAENCNNKLELEDQEGFAQWTAYKTLEHFSYREFGELMVEGSTVYATGLVKMLSIEKERGAAGVFSYIKSRK